MQTQHGEAHRLGSAVREIVFGVHDGGLTVLGFVSGAAGIFADSRTIFFTGLAGMIAEGISMGVGEYQSITAQNEIIEHQRRVEEQEIRTKPKLEFREICDIYCKKGFSKIEARKIALRITANRKQWVDTMMTEELGFPPNHRESPLRNGVIIGLASFIGGFIPIASYLFFAKGPAVLASVVLSAFVGFFRGVLKGRYPGKPWLSAGIKLMVVALLTAVVTFYIGEFLGRVYAS